MLTGACDKYIMGGDNISSLTIKFPQILALFIKLHFWAKLQIRTSAAERVSHKNRDGIK